MNESVASYLNTSYISFSKKKKKNEAYESGDQPTMIFERPNTSIDSRIKKREASHKSPAPSVKSSKHRRCASMTQTIAPQKQKSNKLFGIDGYRTPH